MSEYHCFSCSSHSLLVSQSLGDQVISFIQVQSDKEFMPCSWSIFFRCWPFNAFSSLSCNQSTHFAEATPWPSMELVCTTAVLTIYFSSQQQNGKNNCCVCVCAHKNSNLPGVLSEIKEKKKVVSCVLYSSWQAFYSEQCRRPGMGQELSPQYNKREAPPTQLVMRSPLQAVKDLSLGPFSHALTVPIKLVSDLCPQHHLTWLFQSLVLGLVFL